MKKIKPNQTERGITLIALVITIVLLVILAAVVIRGLTGNEGIIQTGLTATESYNVKQDLEKLQIEVSAIIVSHAAAGEEVSTSQIAADLNEQTSWIKSAYATEYGDVIVTTISRKCIPSILQRSIWGNIYRVHRER